MRKRRTKVIVALSGGVDSSVAAALLKEQGFFVEGVFMRLRGEKIDSVVEERARAVCEKLGISFHVLKLEKEFKEKVIDSFLSVIKKGETPNPCVICNREIKFQSLSNRLEVFSADYFATGHYVLSENGKILRGKDKSKDQSYFLWKMKKEWIEKAIFPLGNYGKKEVRLIAKKYNLPTTSVSESQEICFVERDIYDFLERHLSSSPGKIIDTKGNLLGEHNGLAYYTIGQRKKIGLAGGPYYVLEKNSQKNELIVTRNEKDLFKKEIFLDDVNLLREVSFPLKVRAKIRYRGSLRSGILQKEKITFLSPQRAVTPGQSAVFYNGEELIGGGIIK